MQKIRIMLLATMMLGLPILEANAAKQAAAAEEGLEYLLFDEIPVVVTASKVEQTLDRTTSIVTVITEADIRSSGARTIWEVLKRVPGFFPTVTPSWTVTGARGFLSDGNDHVLLLIDGHPLNSIIQSGFQQQADLPILEKVKKIEIIRGPGSVLWGADAVYGIINVITKDSVEAPVATITYGDADGMTSANYMDSIKINEDVSTLFSFTYWKEDGWTVDDAINSKSGQIYGGTRAQLQAAHSPVEFQWGKFYWPPINRQRDGFEFFTKLDAQNKGKITARFVKSVFDWAWDTAWLQTQSDREQKRYYISYEKHTDFNDKLSLDTIIYVDQNQNYIDPNTRDFFSYIKDPDGGNENPLSNTDYQQQTIHTEETAYALELTGNYKVSDANNLKAGTKYIYTEIGPNNTTQTNTYFNQIVESNRSPFYSPLDAVDKTFALYAEDMQSFNDNKTSIFAGGRYDKNNYRDNDSVFLPRGGIIQSLTDTLTVKYIYNTGYFRPNLAYSSVNSITNPSSQADKSEQLYSHDVQLFWKKDRNYAAITLFDMQIDNFIAYTERRNGLTVTQVYQNGGTNKTKGVELEAKIGITERVSLYGNYSYAKAKLIGELTGVWANQDGEPLNYPKNMYNIGTDILVTDNSIMNLHVNGFWDMPYLKQIGEYSYYGEEGKAKAVYLDANFTTKLQLGTPMEFSIFCDNIFDKQDAIGLVANNGVYYPRGRNLGGKVSVSF